MSTTISLSFSSLSLRLSLFFRVLSSISFCSSMIEIGAAAAAAAANANATLNLTAALRDDALVPCTFLQPITQSANSCNHLK